MSFAVGADKYDRFMGRYSVPLAPRFADFAGVWAGERVLDVGCGPGALTSELVARVGADAVAAADPAEHFVAAARERNPGIDARVAPAEHLPFADGTFDSVLAQLVVHFMADPHAGIGEMARVSRPGGVVAACVWDHGPGGQGPLSLCWNAVRDIDPANEGEARLAGSSQGDLTRLFEAAGLRDVEESSLSVSIEHQSFDEWWEPYTLGVGPVGVYVAGLDETRRTQLRERCRELLPAAPFTLTVRAWTARGRPAR